MILKQNIIFDIQTIFRESRDVLLIHESYFDNIFEICF